MATKTKMLPRRADVRAGDTWELSVMFANAAAWEAGLRRYEEGIAGFAEFKGKLGTGAGVLAACLAFDAAHDRLGEKVGVYASLRAAEDQGDSESQRMRGRYQHAATLAGEASAYVRPEILAIPPKTMARFLKSPLLAEWKLTLERILRYRPHTLGRKEEQLLAMQGQMSGAAGAVFRQLNDADLKFGTITNERGETVELGHSSFAALLRSPNRTVRKRAFHQYYAQYEWHKHGMAAALNGANQRDAYYAKARGHGSAVGAALFPDNVPMSVYDNLIASVRRHLPAVHRYYELRRRALKLVDVHVYDTYVPIIAGVEKRTPWDAAVKSVVEALEPLGAEYTRVLGKGLTTGRWCDRYPNAGKQSGAFSSGSFDAPPYILMNYQPEVLDHVFTLAHEAGHSMHSYYSAKTQPFQYYNYTIFVAEVASTFNEQLLLSHLVGKAKDRKTRAFLLNHAIDEIRGTIVRQTMFAEFERASHALVERGEPLTVDACRREYRTLLDAYFGPGFTIDPELELECLRIPHFYRAFYVYKYATGLSAAIALSERVLNGGRRELADYLNFLKGGCGKDPLDLLKGAGVDMTSLAPVDAAMARFERLVAELEELV